MNVIKTEFYGGPLSLSTPKRNGMINFLIFQMEPETKLFPAIFVEATSKEILQIELGRTSMGLPLSAAILPTGDKHATPQFPPRLKVQCLKPHQWARVRG